MAKEKKQEFVTHITPRSEDFSQWYTDVILQTQLCDYAPVRGCMVIRPYGYAIWERIQEEMDRRFKATGHENVYFPMLIPESLLLKEAEHVEGFAPEVAWVTQGGTEKLQERLAVRPTSETIFCTMYSKWVQTWRDLPIKYNQWCSVMRWEKTTRPFLRTSEFLWQEGHTLHATPEEAQEETLTMLEVYREVAEKALALPVYGTEERQGKVRRRPGHLFHGGHDAGRQGPAGGHQPQLRHQLCRGLQHPVPEQGRQAHLCPGNQLGREHPPHRRHHHDPRRRARIAPAPGDRPHSGGDRARGGPQARRDRGLPQMADQLKEKGFRVKLDDRDTVSPGFKFNDWEMKGVPVRVEIGPRDLENGVVMAFRRDTLEKFTVPMAEIAEKLPALLDDIQQTLYNQAKAFRDERTVKVHNMEELGQVVQTGFAKAMWCGEQACEDEIKEKFNASSRNMPFDQEGEAFGDTCVCCGKKAKKVMYFAKAY